MQDTIKTKELEADLARLRESMSSASRQRLKAIEAWAAACDAEVAKRKEAEAKLAPAEARVKELEGDLIGARKVNARLTQVDFSNADIIDRLQDRLTASESARRGLVEALTKTETTLTEIRNSAGSQVMVCTTEGHSECVHRANAILPEVRSALAASAKLDQKGEGV